MFQEQRQRQAKQEQENAALDAEIQKEIGKIRSADTADVVNGYQGYKALKKQLLFDKKLQRDPIAFAEAQKNANLMLANVQGTINKSKELKDFHSGLVKERFSHGELFDDNSGEYINALQNTPISGLGSIMKDGKPLDLTNYDTYKYKGGNTNWNKLMEESMGDEQPVYGKPIPVGKEGLQEDIPVYTTRNNPAQIKSALIGQMGLRGAGRDASYWLKSITPEQSQSIIEAYKNTPKDKLEKMGLKDLPDIMPKNAESDTDVASSLMAMQAFNGYEPKLHKTERRDNKEAIRKSDRAWDMYLNGVKFNHAKELKKIKSADGKEEEVSFDPVEEMWVEAQKNPRVYTKADGTKEKRFSGNLTQAQKELFAYKGGDKPIYPDEYQFSEDGKYITPIFFSGSASSTGNRAVDKEISRPIPVSIIRGTEAQKTFGVKEAKNIMKGKQTKKQDTEEDYDALIKKYSSQ